MFASVKALLSSVVDYAGLFPPAKLNMAEAMANYAQDQMTPYNWMLGRFVVPASRLHELEQLLTKFPLKQWSLSVILSGDLELDINWVRSHVTEAVLKERSHYNNHKITITSLEFPPLPPAEIEKILPRLPIGIDCFFEIPLNGDLEAYLTVLQRSAALAKIRTGGISVDAFPSVTQLCQCIFSFAKAGVGFKATAGLHHPIPAKYPLTYEPDSPSTEMYGFLNVAVLAALVYWQKVTKEEAIKLLKESSLEGFQFPVDSIAWRNHHLNLPEIEEVRQRFFYSFGSCSFQEPTNDLKKLNLI